MTEKMVTFDDIPSNVKMMYDLREDNGRIIIGSPSYIAVDDAVVQSMESDITVNIRNEFVVVTLWKESKIMTITVFYDKEMAKFVRKWRAKRFKRKLDNMLKNRRSEIAEEPKEELIVPEPPGLSELFG